MIDRLNKVINESILGASIIRVINSQQLEYDKFLSANTEAKKLGLSILRLFAWLIPVIIFTANMAGLGIPTMGGKFVISGSMPLGDFAAFGSYLSLLIFPILVIGFMSNVIAQASATANIDTITEQILQDILNKLPASTTRVIIAHRLNTIQNADEIFFVNKVRSIVPVHLIMR